VPTLVIEKNERAGDSWRKRYRSLVLHDRMWYDHCRTCLFPITGGVLRRKTRSATWMGC